MSDATTPPTSLYDAARALASEDPGHPAGCQWYSTNGSFCSCYVWPAACAGATAAFALLARAGERL